MTLKLCFVALFAAGVVAPKFAAAGHHGEGGDGYSPKTVPGCAVVSKGTRHSTLLARRLAYFGFFGTYPCRERNGAICVLHMHCDTAGGNISTNRAGLVSELAASTQLEY